MEHSAESPGCFSVTWERARPGSKMGHTGERESAPGRVPNEVWWRLLLSIDIRGRWNERIREEKSAEGPGNAIVLAVTNSRLGGSALSRSLRPERIPIPRAHSGGNFQGFARNCTMRICSLTVSKSTCGHSINSIPDQLRASPTYPGRRTGTLCD